MTKELKAFVAKDDNAELICALAQESMFGMDAIQICIECNDTSTGLEPDVERRKCHSCGASHGVYGVEATIPLALGFVNFRPLDTQRGNLRKRVCAAAGVTM